MREYRLEELFDLQMGKTPARGNSEYWIYGIHDWISIKDLTNSGKYIEQTKEKLSDFAVEESKIKLIPKDTVIMSFKLSIGKVAITPKEMYSNEAIMAFHDKGKEKVLPEYLYYLFLGKDWSAGSNKAVMGITLNKATLSKVKVKIHDIEKQKSIVNVLNKASKLISLKEKQLEELDTLIKSRFVEMFGDSYLNTKAYPQVFLEEAADVVSGITKGRKTKESKLIEVPYMAVSNVKDGYIDWTTVKTIQATQNEIERYKIEPDDILMTEGGDPDKLGRGAIIKNLIENCIHQNHIFRVRLDKSLVSPEYFEEYLQHARAKRYFLKSAKQTTGIASINMGQLKRMPVLLPSVELQNEFADFVQHIDKLKFEVQKSLDETQVLFDSLMKEYFE